ELPERPDFRRRLEGVVGVGHLFRGLDEIALDVLVAADHVARERERLPGGRLSLGERQRGHRRDRGGGQEMDTSPGTSAQQRLRNRVRRGDPCSQERRPCSKPRVSSDGHGRACGKVRGDTMKGAKAWVVVSGFWLFVALLYAGQLVWLSRVPGERID